MKFLIISILQISAHKTETPNAAKLTAKLGISFFKLSFVTLKKNNPANNATTTAHTVNIRLRINQGTLPDTKVPKIE